MAVGSRRDKTPIIPTFHSYCPYRPSGGLQSTHAIAFVGHVCFRMRVGEDTHCHWAKPPETGHIPILSAVAEYKSLGQVSNPPESLAPRPRFKTSDPDAGLSVGLVGGHLPRTSLTITRYAQGSSRRAAKQRRTALWESVYWSE